MGNCLKCFYATEETSPLPEAAVSPAESPQRADLPPPYEVAASSPIFFPSLDIGLPASQLTEDEQVRIAKRIGLIQQLPVGVYDGSSKKNRECVICMIEFTLGDMVRFLPCLHTYHKACIDDWLMRSFTCPSCMEPVDAALLTSYQTT